MTRRYRPILTSVEIADIDPQCIDSVTADKLVHTAAKLHEHFRGEMLRNSQFVHQLVAMWIAKEQGELEEAAEWVIADVDCWLDIDEIAKDPWAHDWRKFMASRRSGEPTPPCQVCGHPSIITGQDLHVCSQRHADAVKGTLPDERCVLCGQVKVCAFEADDPGVLRRGRTPVCADCWPGERVIAQRRAEWAARFTTTEEATR